jgi:mRNA (guanine-N7-)-methyltransferase
MKRDRPEVMSSENAKVADHYSARPNQGVEARTESAIFRLRNFNNWVKSVLISLHLRGPGASVLDLAGGKGGDFSKWKNAAIGHLVLADVAHVSVEHARDRYLNSSANLHRLFPALFIAADCFGAPLFDKVDPELRFDLVSCQFAFHYAFESEERLRVALRNVSERLRPGACFIGTVPNAYRLVQLLRSSRGLSWSNSIVSIDFDPATDKDCLPEFGARYTFALLDAVDRVPEFLVHFAVLERVAAEYGLELIMREEFSSLYQRLGNDVRFRDLLTDVMRVDSLSPDEWQAACLYVAFAFRKRGTEAADGPRSNKKTFAHDYDSIIVL